MLPSYMPVFVRLFAHFHANWFFLFKQLIFISIQINSIHRLFACWLLQTSWNFCFVDLILNSAIIWSIPDKLKVFARMFYQVHHACVCVCVCRRLKLYRYCLFVLKALHMYWNWIDVQHMLNNKIIEYYLLFASLHSIQPKVNWIRVMSDWSTKIPFARSNSNEIIIKLFDCE